MQYRKCVLPLVLKDILLSLLISVTLRGRDQMDEESFVSVVETAAHEEIREVVVVEERKIIEEAPRRLQEVLQPLVTVTERDDDWFELLGDVPRKTSYVPPGIAEIPCYASQLYQSKQLP